MNVDSFTRLSNNISQLKIHTLIVIHFSAHLRTYFPFLMIYFMSKNKSKIYEHIKLQVRRDCFFIFTTWLEYDGNLREITIWSIINSFLLFVEFLWRCRKYFVVYHERNKDDFHYNLRSHNLVTSRYLT